jgi:UDP-N-acetylglucosamine 1-carboxyvinyltransferase
MDKFIIQGGNRLQGTITVGGAKNAALPILIASLLTSEECSFDSVPDLHDVSFTNSILSELGTKVERTGKQSYLLQSDQVHSTEAPYEFVKKMRASILVLGPLLARFGKAKVSLPGGCVIGARPIQWHIEAFKQMGATIELKDGYVLAEAKRLKGCTIDAAFPSVGLTENIMMAASLAEGETILNQGAREPEIVDLANALNSMGASIKGAGTNQIRILGKEKLSGCKHKLLGDRIQAGTYLAAAFATKGNVRIKGVSPNLLAAALVMFEEAGATIKRGESFIELRGDERPKALDITTLPYPGFPTDLQAQFMTLMTMAKGESIFNETIFENRFMHVPELRRMRADIDLKGNIARVKGVPQLLGAQVMATDLRASACLVIAGLCAEGETEVNRVYHIDRGYENIVAKLSSLGAKIERVSG